MKSQEVAEFQGAVYGALNPLHTNGYANPVCYNCEEMVDGFVIGSIQMGDTFTGSSASISILPNLGGVARVINSVMTGSLLLACRNARMGFIRYTK